MHTLYVHHDSGSNCMRYVAYRHYIYITKLYSTYIDIPNTIHMPLFLLPGHRKTRNTYLARCSTLLPRRMFWKLWRTWNFKCPRDGNQIGFTCPIQGEALSFFFFSLSLSVFLLCIFN